MEQPDDPLARDLAALAALPGTPRLATLEAGVFAAIDEQARRRRDIRALGTWVVAGALSLGLIGGGIAGATATREERPLPIGIERHLVPSVLLS
jgi:hypothetical protein